jgi:hypothetical protein
MQGISVFSSSLHVGAQGLALTLSHDTCMIENGSVMWHSFATLMKKMALAGMGLRGIKGSVGGAIPTR